MLAAGGLLVVMVTVGVVVSERAPTTRPPVRQPPAGVEARREGLQPKLDGFTTAGGAPGVVARFDEGPTHWTGAAGVSDLTDRSSLSPQSRFRVGSITKTFVAAVALQLVGEERLALDVPVAAWLPGLLPDGETITLRQLLGHRSGVADYTEDAGINQGIQDNLVFRPAELVAAATARTLLFPPGTRWSYSNTNYIVAGLLVEQVTGNSLEAELQRRIFGPLGLDHTSFPIASASIDGAQAHGYLVPAPGAPLLDVTAINPSHAWAAGGVVSTADDVSRFYRSLLGGDVLAPGMLDAMLTTSPVSDDPGQSYGLGIMAKATPCGTFWGHDGNIPGYSAWSFHAEDGVRSLTEMVNMFPVPPALDAPREALRSILCDPPAPA